MLPQIGYATAHETATEVCNALAGRPPRDYMVRQRSRFHPDSTMWWVVPGRQNPAYRYGKLFFDYAHDDTSKLMCGLHVEKGLDPVALGPKDHLMGPGWTWRSFFPQLGTEVAKQAGNLEQRLQTPIAVHLLAHLVPPKPRSYCLRFRWSAGKLQLEQPGGATVPTDNYLAPLQQASSLADLQEGISHLPQVGWHWLNVFLGIDVALGGDAGRRDVWDAIQLLESALSVWLPWVR